jgi:hypothetical protein
MCSIDLYLFKVTSSHHSKDLLMSSDQCFCYLKKCALDLIKTYSDGYHHAVNCDNK